MPLPRFRITCRPGEAPEVNLDGVALDGVRSVRLATAPDAVPLVRLEMAAGDLEVLGVGVVEGEMPEPDRQAAVREFLLGLDWPAVQVRAANGASFSEPLHEQFRRALLEAVGG